MPALRSIALSSFALAALAGAPRPAAACSLLGTFEHQLDSAYSTDRAAPSAVAASVEVRRSADDAGCGGMSSCGDLALIAISVEATDDAAPADKLGYQLRVVGGDLPAGLTIPTAAVTSEGSGLYFYFDYDDRSGFDLALEIRARDLNGNLGPPTVITIGEPGESGCATGHSATLGGALLALLAVLARPRRRR